MKGEPVDTYEQPRFNVALVGASSLKGKEVKAMLQERSFPLGRLALLDAEETRGQLTDFEGEPAVILPVTKESFEGMAFVIFAASPAFTEQHWQLAEQSGCDVIDLSYHLDTHPQARLLAPAIESLEEPSGAPAPETSPHAQIAVVAHPAAAAIAGLLTQIGSRFAIERSVITVYEPVSEHGMAGVEELHRQTANLFSFQEIPRDVFDTQIAFNLLSRYGEQCRFTLRDAQERIGAHVRALLDGRAPQPALRLLQAPTFYGHAFCCYVELKKPVPGQEVEEAIGQRPFAILRDPDDPPTLVGVAGSDEIALGPVESDPAGEAGYWIWGTLDSMRLAARNAVEIAEQRISARLRLPAPR